MRPSAVLLISALFVFVVVKAEQDEECIAYDGSLGDCICLSKCNHLLEMVMSAKRRKMSHQDAIKIIQQSNCGYIQNEPLVCCPGSTEINDEKENNGVADSPQSNDSDSTIQSSPPKDTPGSTLKTTQTPVVTTTASPPSPSTPSPASSPSTPSSTDTPSQQPPSGFTNSPSTVNSPTPDVTSPPTSAETPTIAPPSTQTPSTPTPSPTPEASSPTTIDSSSVSPVTETPPENDKSKLLPEECGRVLTFKYFYGNRTDFDDFPWIALVDYETPEGRKLSCGGSLINDHYVLTAAHCVRGLKAGWRVAGVRFGEYDTSTEIDCLLDGPAENSLYCSDKPVDVAVEEVTVHPGYLPTDGGRLHDIALLRLTKAVNFTEYVKPICLPRLKPDPQRYYTSGWGKNIDASVGTSLKYMSYITLAERGVCSKTYKTQGLRQLGESQICAGSKPSERPCIGDAGGPLMGIEERPGQKKRVTAFGILSLTSAAAVGDKSSSCYRGGQPAVYTYILDYVPWIISQLRK